MKCSDPLGRVCRLLSVLIVTNQLVLIACLYLAAR